MRHRNTVRHTNRVRSRRRGSVLLEWLLVLPVLLIAFFAAFELGTLQYVQSTITHAATVGARVAGKDTAEIGDVVDAVNLILTAIDLEVVDVPGSGARIFFEDGPSLLDRTDFGDSDLDCEPPSNPVLNPDEARVTVCASVGVTPVIDAGNCYGITLDGRTFRVSSLVNKELPQPSPPAPP